MSSIMRARSGLTRRSERLESIGDSSLKLKVADLQCSGSDAPTVTPYCLCPSPTPRRTRTPRCRALPRERVRSLPGCGHLLRPGLGGDSPPGAAEGTIREVHASGDWGP